MDCRQIDKYIYEFCDNQMPPKLREQMQCHLDECERCRNKVELAQSETTLLRNLPIIPVRQSQFTDQVMASVQAHCTHNRPRLLPSRYVRYPRKLRRWWGVAGAASVAVLLLTIVSLSYLQPLGTKLADQSPANSHLQTEMGPRPELAETVPKLDFRTEEPAADLAKEALPSAAQDSYQNPPVQTETRTEPVLPQAVPGTTEPATVAQPSPHYSTVADTNEAMKSARILEPNRGGADVLTLYPANLPSDYTLQSIISPSNYEITFVYANQLNDGELKLTIAKEESQQTDEKIYLDQEPPDLLDENKPRLQRDLTGLSTHPDEYEPNDNSVKRLVGHGQQPYRITLTAEIDTEELTEIANAIRLEEGANRAQTTHP